MLQVSIGLKILSAGSYDSEIPGITLIGGGVRTGKTTLLLGFIQEALLRGETVGLVVTDEPAEFMATAQALLKLDLKPYLKDRQLFIFQYCDFFENRLRTPVGFQIMVDELEWMVRERGITVLALDTFDPVLASISPVTLKPFLRMFVETVRSLDVSCFITAMGGLEILNGSAVVQELAGHGDMMLVLNRKGSHWSMEYGQTPADLLGNEPVELTLVNGSGLLFEADWSGIPRGALNAMDQICAHGVCSPDCVGGREHGVDVCSDVNALPHPLRSAPTLHPAGRASPVLQPQSQYEAVWEDSLEEIDVEMVSGTDMPGSAGVVNGGRLAVQVDGAKKPQNKLNRGGLRVKALGVAVLAFLVINSGNLMVPLSSMAMGGQDKSSLSEEVHQMLKGFGEPESASERGPVSGGEAGQGDGQYFCGSDGHESGLERECGRGCGRGQVMQETGRLWSEGGEENLRQAVNLLDQYLQECPRDGDMLLRRARIRSSLGDKGELRHAGADYQQYLALDHIESAARVRVSLDLAAVLSWIDDEEARRESIRLYQEYLEQRPDDYVVLLKMAKVKSWAGWYGEAVEDMQAYLDFNGGDRDARHDLARALTGAGRFALAEAEYAKLEQEYPLSPAMKLDRARSLLWSGKYQSAEMIFLELVGLERNLPVAAAGVDGGLDGGLDWDANTDTDVNSVPIVVDWPELDSGHGEDAELVVSEAQRAEIQMIARQAQMELVKAYHYSGKRLKALNEIDKVLEREPEHVEARQLQQNLQKGITSWGSPAFSVFADGSQVRRYEMAMDGEIALSPRLSLLGDYSAGQLTGASTSSINSQRLNLGALFRAGDSLSFRATAGPRLTAGWGFTAGLGTEAGISLSPMLSVRLGYTFDDVYEDNYPDAMDAGITSHKVSTVLSGKVHDFAGWARVQGELLSDHNTGLSANGSFLYSLFKPLSVGYSGYFKALETGSPLYWSPTWYHSHQGVIRFSQQHKIFSKILQYHGQAGMGAATGKTSQGLYSGWGLAYGGNAGLNMQVGKSGRLGVQCMGGRTERESSQYWWLSGDLYFNWVF